VHARRTRPEAGHLDRRRLVGAGLSAILPGLGQLVNGRRRLALIFLVPSLVLATVIAALVLSQTMTRLTAWVVTPSVLSTVLVLNVVTLVWTLVAVGLAYLDTRWHGPTSRLGLIGIVIITGLVTLPHLMIWRYGTALEDTFGRVFTGNVLGAESTDPPAAGPGTSERYNVLILGVDALPSRPATLTDTMIVASLDPVGHSVSMVSIPRDLVSVPLGDGNVFGPKLNSLMAYADRNPDEFPDGGEAALQRAIGALLGIDIHGYARMDFSGFVDMIDAVGGVDIDVKQAIDDPTYDGYGTDQRGVSFEEGLQHFDGLDALAFARVRKAVGESDFTRAGRQQQILVGLRTAVTRDGSLLWKLPDLLDAVGGTITTNIPISKLPALAAVLDEVDADAVTRAVVRHPLVKSKDTRYGSSLVPDLPAIRSMAGKLFSPPGIDPLPWPTPKPTKAPKVTASPSP
jgi:LCP family protein required for cell wall assembly